MKNTDKALKQINMKRAAAFLSRGKLFTLSLVVALLCLASCSLLDLTSPLEESHAAETVSITPPPAEQELDPAPIAKQPEATSLPRQNAGVLNISMRPPQTLNPLLNTDVTVDAVLKLLYEPLVVLDETLKPTGHLAGYYFSSDYTSVNLIIRNDAIWSDGIPVSAEDAAFSIETLKTAPEEAVYKHCVANIAHYEIVDTKTLKIFFTEVHGDSPYRLAFPLIPAHAENLDTVPLGNGLFSFETLFPNEKITLLQSPYTFRRQADIERVNVLFVPDRQTEIHAFNQSLIDVLPMSVSEWTKQKSVKRVRSQDRPAMQFDFIGFNFANPLTRQLRFREAVAQAFDLDEAVASTYLDHALRAPAPVNPASWAAIDPDIMPYNPETAAQKIREAGRNAPAVSTVRVLVNEEDDERVKIAKELTAALRECGLVTVLEAESFDVFTEKVNGGAFEILLGSYNLSMIPDLRFAFGSEGNILRYSNPLMDDLLTAVENAFSETEYAGALAAIQEFTAEELPVIGLAFRNGALLTDERVTGDLWPSAEDVFANINEWSVE